MNEVVFRIPSNQKEYEEYDLFRWRMLRKPIGKTIESLKDEYEDSSIHIIGVSNNKIIACGRLHFIDDAKAQIRYMAVDEKYQGQGIGSDLLSVLENHAIENSANKIILNARNHAIKFYTTSKYKILKKYYGSDTGIPHTTMTKDI